MASSTFNRLSDEEIAIFAESADKIAERVSRNSLRSSANRVNIVGPRASLGEQKNGLMIDHNVSRILVTDSNKESYIFNGLDGATIKISGRRQVLSSGQVVVLPGKVNHVLIRDCHHTRIKIDDGVISGVTILKCKGVVVDLPFQNTTSIEETIESRVRGRITRDSIVYVTASQEIDINDESLHVHPFVQGIFTGGFFFPTGYIPPGLDTLDDEKSRVVRVRY